MSGSADPAAGGTGSRAGGWHRNTERVLAAAARAGLAIEVLRYPEGTRTARDAARAIGCDVGAIVKSLVLDSAGGPFLVLASGGNQVDLTRAGALLSTSEVRRAEAATVRAATGFPIGGTAPLGHPHPLRVLMDRDLLAHDRVWAAAGTPDTVFAAAPGALAAATDATVADVRAG